MFICDKCGECCRNLHKSDLYKELNNGNGICRYLKENYDYCEKLKKTKENNMGFLDFLMSDKLYER